MIRNLFKARSSATVEEESGDLRVHVAACRERYKTLFYGMRRIEALMLLIAGTFLADYFFGGG